MDSHKKDVAATCRYYIDESGDGVLFDKKGRLLLNSPSCRKFFILGLLHITNPEKLEEDFRLKRAEILRNPYFEGVPSLQHEAKKTALFFHAKDDLPEIRWEVFKLLLTHDLRFFAVVKSMWAVYEYVRGRNTTDPSYRYRPEELYDFTVRRLLKERMHKEDNYIICFARRGNTLRSKMLIEQLKIAKDKFCKEKQMPSQSVIDVLIKNSYQDAGLQAVDYFLWALQRFYENKEERFIKYIWEKVALIQDVDDTRQNQYGAYYSRKNPLTLESIKENGLRI